jgi:hypothetical protein
MGSGGSAVGRMTRQRIKFLDKTHLTQKDTDAFVGVLKRAKRGKLSSEDRIWLKKKAVFYKEKAKNSLPFMQDHKQKSGNPNPSPKAETDQHSGNATFAKGRRSESKESELGGR